MRTIAEILRDGLTEKERVGLLEEFDRICGYADDGGICDEEEGAAIINFIIKTWKPTPK